MNAVRRNIVETMFAMNQTEKAAYHGEKLLNDAGLVMLMKNTVDLIDDLDSYVGNLEWDDAESGLIFTVLGMNFVPVFSIQDIEVLVERDSFEVFFPVLGREPESFQITTDAELHDFEGRMAEVFMRGLRTTENDWLYEFYTEVGLRHPVYLEIQSRIGAILQSLSDLKDDYELRGAVEIVDYFYIAVMPRLEEILKRFEG